MIKKLFFTAVLCLLAPGVAFAGNPSAQLTVQPSAQPTIPPSATQTTTFVPAGSNIACDAGPNYTGSPPPPAANAGFTHCALNADFSNPVYSNISSWLGNCGAPDTLWQFYWDVRFGGAGNCARANMETDATIGKQVLHLQEQPSDNPGDNYAFALDFPGWGWARQHQVMFPAQMYFEITFKFSPGSLTEGSAPAGPIDIYINGYAGGGACYTETDFIEYYGGNPNWAGGMLEWCNGTIVGGAGVIQLSMDLSQYHTLSILTTSDGATKNAKCAWVDGVPKGCQYIDVPAVCNGQGSSCVSDNFIGHGLIMSAWVGQGTSNKGSNNVDMYIQSERIWECPGYRSASTFCFGTPITSQ